MSDGPRLRWEIRYMAYPYLSWTHERYASETDARAAFEDLWASDPQPVNLSMRSHRLDVVPRLTALEGGAARARDEDGEIGDPGPSGPGEPSPRRSTRLQIVVSGSDTGDEDEDEEFSGDDETELDEFGREVEVTLLDEDDPNDEDLSDPDDSQASSDDPTDPDGTGGPPN